jgi:ATP/maltotriose-dependent transcriptional regulator MalT/DNA-binding SARP family transcriptional activator
MSLAKITRPSVDGMLFRERLFQRLDEPGMSPVVWISGPAGSGKTTLASSYLEARDLPHLWYQVDGGDTDLATFFYYLGLAVQNAASDSRKTMPLLTPEYMLGIPEFSRNFFAELFGRLKEPAVLVFDNTQEVLGESPFYGAIIEGLTRMPADIRIVMVSRSEPPPQFARLRASRMLELLGWLDLRLTLDESTAIAQQRVFAEERSATFSRLHKQVGGWAAGLKLVLEGSVNLSGSMAVAMEDEPEEIFDYFAAEVFERVDTAVQDCLIKTAFLPRIHASLAVQLTGNERAGLILNDLYRRNFFITKLARPQTTYEYYPLFREFLLTMADARFSFPDLVHIKKEAALLLEADGQIDEAMALFLLTEDYPNLIRLLLDQAPAFLVQGRHHTLERLLYAIPGEVLANTPWLLFWLGATRMPSDPAAGRPLFEQALELFDECGDEAGVFLAWSGAVDSIVYTFDSFTSLDEWIRMFGQLVGRYPTFPNPEIEVRVITSLLHILALRQPFHPDFGMWEKRGLSAVSADSDITLKVNIHLPLLMAAIFGGDLVKAEKLLWGLKDDIRSTDHCSLAMITLKNFEAFYSWMAGRFEECESAVTEALELSWSSGIKLLVFMIMCHGTSGMLSTGNLKGAKQYLDKISTFLNRQGRCEQGLYHILKVWQGLLDQKPQLVLFHAEKSLQLLLEMGMPQAIAHSYLAMGYGLHEMGKHELAANHLSKAREFSIKTNIRQAEFACWLAEADLAYDCGDNELGTQSLRKALSLGRKHGFFNCYFWRSAVMARLCCKALEAGIEKAYVQELIRRRKLMPESPPLEIETWPWPLRIYTLGRFELVRDGKPVRFAGKAQQKPLALLKALIALGGRKVGESTLTEALWPDADGDMQHQALATTLHRLRRLLGEKEAIENRDGQLSLNVSYCWVDAWAFERLLSKAETESKKSKGDGKPLVAYYAEKAIDFYKGPFLPQNNEEHWSIYMRERLMSRFLRGVVFLGRTLEQIGEREKAVVRYLQALEVDLKVEEFYQRLMVCYNRMGRNADAVAVYKRCQKNLNSMLKVEPSSQTKTIYRNILAKSVSRASN